MGKIVSFSDFQSRKPKGRLITHSAKTIKTMGRKIVFEAHEPAEIVYSPHYKFATGNRVCQPRVRIDPDKAGRWLEEFLNFPPAGEYVPWIMDIPRAYITEDLIRHFMWVRATSEPPQEILYDLHYLQDWMNEHIRFSSSDRPVHESNFPY